MCSSDLKYGKEQRPGDTGRRGEVVVVPVTVSVVGVVLGLRELTPLVGPARAPVRPRLRRSQHEQHRTRRDQQEAHPRVPSTLAT